MSTPIPVIRAYIRRIEREDITLDDIRDERTREDVAAYMSQDA